MKHIAYKDNELYIENVSARNIANNHTTPMYIYSYNSIKRQFASYSENLQGISNLICFAVKSNNNLAILNLLANLGSGFDVVSKGELQRVLTAGGDAKKIVFSGSCKLQTEIIFALQHRILCINIESIEEISLVNQCASQLNIVADISIRINPHIRANTHKYISTGDKAHKFGICLEDALAAYKLASSLKNINIIGINCHIGSQITEITPFFQAQNCCFDLIKKLTKLGIEIKYLNMGGGLGIDHAKQNIANIKEYTTTLKHNLLANNHANLCLIIEPGRSIIATAGILLAKIHMIKNNRHKNFIFIDAAMNDFIRPAMYNAWHDIIPVTKNIQQPIIADIVGPICETSDCFGINRRIAAKKGDLLAITDVGAYGSVMSSNYNSRNRPAEILVRNNEYHMIRRADTIADQLAQENIPQGLTQ